MRYSKTFHFEKLIHDVTMARNLRNIPLVDGAGTAADPKDFMHAITSQFNVAITATCKSEIVQQWPDFGGAVALGGADQDIPIGISCGDGTTASLGVPFLAGPDHGGPISLFNGTKLSLVGDAGVGYHVVTAFTSWVHIIYRAHFELTFHFLDNSADPMVSAVVDSLAINANAIVEAQQAYRSV
jgi:hypothetical protein